MKISKWMVYYRDRDGHREGNEYIMAPSRPEALRLYRLFFNIPRDLDVIAIPVI